MSVVLCAATQDEVGGIRKKCVHNIPPMALTFECGSSVKTQQYIWTHKFITGHVGKLVYIFTPSHGGCDQILYCSFDLFYYFFAVFSR